jgi:mycothiol system anti-sigma-R factor
MGEQCVETWELLYQYMDGTLTEERRVVMTRHLDDCPPCGDAFEFETELRFVIAERCRERVPEHLRRRVAEALEHLQE